MTKKYETLDEYLDDLDAIKEQVAENIRDMSPEQVSAYFAGAARRLQEKIGPKRRPRRSRQRTTTAKR